VTTARKPTAIDCFAGAGGLSLGLSEAGLRVVAAFDSDPDACASYSSNLGAHILQSKAEELKGEHLLRKGGIIRGQCALVAGGPPCQGFSRQRRGDSQDTRNELVLEFLRLVLEIKPTMFLMENVSAIGGPRGRKHLEAVTKKAESQGYRVTSRVLDAADFGVPQHRRRLFLVGEVDDGFQYFTFPSATHDSDRYVNVRDAIGDLPCPMKDPEKAAAFPNHEPDNISDLNRKRISYVPEGGGRENIPDELKLPCHRVSVDIAGHRFVYGRLSWNEPAGTITTKCNSFTRGRFAHPSENRNITMREAARLQGFPDSYIFEGGKVPIAHQVGNAVPPPLAKALGSAIVRALALRKARKGTPSPPRQLTLKF